VIARTLFAEFGVLAIVLRINMFLKLMELLFGYEI
jgi:hypothetical protein